MELRRLAEEDFDFQLYRYIASLPSAIVCAIVFAILTALHAWRLWKIKAYYFIAFTVGGLFQTVSYSFRIWGHYDKFDVPAFAVQACLILVAPALYAASIYMILGRLIRTVGAEHLAVIPAQWITRVFVVGDIVSFSVQSAGAGLQAGGTLDRYKTGEKIIIAGLFIQTAVFGFFVVTSVLFHARLRRRPTIRSERGDVPWQRYLYVLYASGVIILIRSIFRVIEYLQGNGGYLISHEIFLYIFDALLMAAVMAILLVWYVEHVQGKRKSSMDEMEISQLERGT